MGISGQFPYRIVNMREQELLQCFPFEEALFQAPFFEFAAQEWLAESQNAPGMFLKIPQELERIAGLPAKAPSAIIFHMSRCGSTLLSQMLSTSDRFRVVSEPEIINSILSSRKSQQEKAVLVKRMVRMFGQTELNEKSLVIKTSSRCLYEVELFRRLYPETLFIFMYRNPAEVISSLMARPSAFIKNVKSSLAIYAGYLDRKEAELGRMEKEELTCLLLKQLLRNMIRFAESERGSNRALFLSYDNLLEDSFQLLENQFHFSPSELSAAEHRSELDSKELKKGRFIPDGEHKRKELTTASLKALDKFQLHESWEKLKKLTSP